MSFASAYNFDLLVNEAERLVLAELERQIGEWNEGELCLCEDCVLDMATFALNEVKPLYRVSLLGSIYAAHAMDEDTYATSVKDAVKNAILRVKENPSHD